MEWINVSEELPPKFEQVLVAYTDIYRTKFVMIAARGDFETWYAGSNMITLRGTVTHWMPLPDHPDSYHLFRKDLDSLSGV